MLLVGAAAVIVALTVIFFLWVVVLEDWMLMRGSERHEREMREREARSLLAYPYYVDADAIRALASSFGIELPVSREVVVKSQDVV